jgi:hypothetical protein
MSKIKVQGREQIFQLGVKFINDKIQNELDKVFVGQAWRESTKAEIQEFFRLKYKELESAMPFLNIKEYPRVCLYMESSGSMKIHLQGWLHDCDKCRLIGGMQYNKDTFYDFYVCMKEYVPYGGNELIVRYGDKPDEIFSRPSSEADYYGVKWKAINKNYKMGFDTILSINPCEILKQEGE